MGYIYLILIFSFLIMIMPSLFKFFLIIWLISIVLNIFRPKSGPRTRQNPFYQEENSQQNYTRKSNDDIIDVEFTQRDSKQDSE